MMSNVQVTDLRQSVQLLCHNAVAEHLAQADPASVAQGAGELYFKRAAAFTGPQHLLASLPS